MIYIYAAYFLAGIQLQVYLHCLPYCLCTHVLAGMFNVTRKFKTLSSTNIVVLVQVTNTIMPLAC